jgi:hypothetical protein
MTEKINDPKTDPQLRDRRISRKARATRALEKIAKQGTQADREKARMAKLDRDAYIDVFADQP